MDVNGVVIIYFLSSREAAGHMKETAQMKKPQCVVESLKVTPITDEGLTVTNTLDHIRSLT